MAKEKTKSYKLDLYGRVLPAIDRNQKDFYSKLTDEERKGYVTLVIMRAMSLLGDQNSNAAYQLLKVNNNVNVDFWSLSKYPELQHLLLCTASLGEKQYHPWVSNKTAKSKTENLDNFLLELNPLCNDEELGILRNSFTAKSIEKLAHDAGKSESEIKLIVEDGKKIKDQTN